MEVINTVQSTIHNMPKLMHLLMEKRLYQVKKDLSWEWITLLQVFVRALKQYIQLATLLEWWIMYQEGSKYNWKVLIKMMVLLLKTMRWLALGCIVIHHLAYHTMKFLYALIPMIQRMCIIVIGLEIRLMGIWNIF